MWCASSCGGLPVEVKDAGSNLVWSVDAFECPGWRRLDEFDTGITGLARRLSTSFLMALFGVAIRSLFRIWCLSCAPLLDGLFLRCRRRGRGRMVLSCQCVPSLDHWHRELRSDPTSFVSGEGGITPPSPSRPGPSRSRASRPWRSSPDPDPCQAPSG